MKAQLSLLFEVINFSEVAQVLPQIPKLFSLVEIVYLSIIFAIYDITNLLY